MIPFFPFAPFGNMTSYTNLHDLDLNWIIAVVKELLTKLNTIDSKILEGNTQLQNTYNTLNTLLQNWYISHSDDIANQLASALDDLNTQLQTNENAFDAHIAQYIANTISSIPADYSTLANEVSNLKKNNAFDVIPHVTGSRTVNGITFAWNSDGSCNISGTATADAREAIYDNTTVLPTGFERGKTYYIIYSASITRLQILSYASGGSTTVLYTGRGEDGVFTIPNDAVGLWIRLLVPNGTSNINETVQPIILNGLSNSQLTGNSVDLAPEVEQLETDVTALKRNEMSMNFSSATNINVGSLWEVGSISPTTGQDVVNSERIRTKTYLPSNIADMELPDDTRGFFILGYNTADTFLGVYRSDGTWDLNGNGNGYTRFNFSPIYQKYANVRLRLYLYSRDGNPITLSEASSIIMHSVFNQLINPITIRVMQYNIGQFNFGHDGGYAGSGIGLKLSNYREMLMKYHPDILCLEEYREYVDSQNTHNADYILFNDMFPYKSYEEYGYVNFLAFQPFNFRHTYLHTEGDYPVHMVYGSVIANNKEIAIGSCALNTEGGTPDGAMKLRALNKMVTLLSGYDTAIIGVDANASSEEEANAIKSFLKQNGFRTANWDYAGYFNTYNPSSQIYKCIDSIFIKGTARFTNIEVVPTSEYNNLLSDHLPVIADITIYK